MQDKNRELQKGSTSRAPSNLSLHRPLFPHLSLAYLPPTITCLYLLFWPAEKPRLYTAFRCLLPARRLPSLPPWAQPPSTHPHPTSASPVDWASLSARAFAPPAQRFRTGAFTANIFIPGTWSCQQSPRIDPIQLYSRSGSSAGLLSIGDHSSLSTARSSYLTPLSRSLIEPIPSKQSRPRPRHNKPSKGCVAIPIPNHRRPNPSLFARRPPQHPTRPLTTFPPVNVKRWDTFAPTCFDRAATNYPSRAPYCTLLIFLPNILNIIKSAWPSAVDPPSFFGPKQNPICRKPDNLLPTTQPSITRNPPAVETKVRNIPILEAI